MKQRMGTERDMQRAIRWYKQETGITDVDMREVALWAVNKKGWALPPPVDPLDRLVRQFSRAARQEIEYDEVTGRPYRVNHALRTMQGGKQLTFWINIDEATRPKMVKTLVKRREQMVGDGLQLSFDQDHWNRKHPDEEPIALPLDLTDDVEWAKNSPEHSPKKAG